MLKSEEISPALVGLFISRQDGEDHSLQPVINFSSHESFVVVIGQVFDRLERIDLVHYFLLLGLVR